MDDLYDFLIEVLRDITGYDNVYATNLKDLQENDFSCVAFQLRELKTNKDYPNILTYYDMNFFTYIKSDKEEDIVRIAEKLFLNQYIDIEYKSVRIIHMRFDDYRYEGMDDKNNYVYSVRIFVNMNYV